MSHLIFNSNLGKQKPDSIRNHNTECPFCDREQLEGILSEKGSIILLKNKFPVLQDTFQTVLIETDECESELSQYPKEHLYDLIHFGVKHWLDMIQSHDFTSVLFFKNHGPHSGGSLRHPHMQIVGLNHLNYLDNVQLFHFEGIPIVETPELLFNISTKPRMGFYELNILLHDLNHINKMADYIQISTHYLLNHFNKHCNSYNLFFYQINDSIAVKVMPRFPSSPLFVGYSIPQVSNGIEEVASSIQNIYL